MINIKKISKYTLFFSMILFNVYAQKFDIVFQNQTESDIVLHLNTAATSGCITAEKLISLSKSSESYPTVVDISDTCQLASIRVIWNINNTQKYIMWAHQNKNGNNTRLVFDLPQYTWIYSTCGDGGSFYCDLSNGNPDKGEESKTKTTTFMQIND